MKMVIIPAKDFEFNGASSPPYSSSSAPIPTTPKRFGDYYLSAPNSPTRLGQIYRDFYDLSVSNSSSAISFDWAEKPGQYQATARTTYQDDFAFDFSQELEQTTLPAEELFESGKIRSLMPQQPSPLKPARRVIDDEYEASNSPSSSSGRRGRSHSPYRVSKYPWEEEEEQDQENLQQKITKQSAVVRSKAPALSSSSKGGSRKWRLKDFFLFRSASEGRAAYKDPLRKYTAMSLKKHDDVRNSIFRANEGPNGSRRRGPVSAHELHYTVNKAVSDDMRKKTFLPYKQGILGRLAFNPAVHALANGFGFSRT